MQLKIHKNNIIRKTTFICIIPVILGIITLVLEC